jgi:galactokinase
VTRPVAVDEPAQELAAQFTRRYGREPAGIWSAPGRVNVIGEHTDYNDGFVLPIALDRTTKAAAAIRADGVARLFSTSEPDPPDIEVAAIAPGAVNGWSAYALGVLWALGEQGVAVPGLDLGIDSDVPTGAGVSSSAALEAAVALAVADLTAADADRPALARACRRAENEVVGAPTGVMDQMAALCGQAGQAMFLDCRTLAVEQVPLDLDASGLVLLLLDTKTKHALVEGAYADRREACAAAARRLGVPALRDATLEQVEARLDGVLARRARHIVTENARVLQVVDRLRAGEPAAIGAILDASHASMREDFEISTPELDLAVEAARAAGALGARLTGGGFGGSAIALTPAASVPAVRLGVATAFAGFAAPEIFEVSPSDGARRLR